MPTSSNIVHSIHKDEKDTREMLIDEQEAVLEYQSASENATNPKAKEIYNHIAEEEEKHIGMLNELLEEESPTSEMKEEEGEEETEDILDKMRVDDMTSEQAWADFKSQYIEKQANDTTLDAKLDTVMSAMQEMKVDIDRITDTVPQIQGELAEQEAIENEEQGEDQIEEFGDDVAPTEEGMPTEEEGDSDFDSLFDFGDEESTDDADNDAEGEESDGEPVLEEDSEEVVSEDTDDDIEESDDDVIETVEEESDDTESEESEEDDFVPIEDIMSEDDESEEEESDDSDEEDTEEVEEESEEESEEDTEEVLEKMVKALSIMDMRITALERENKALRKMMTVKNESPVRKAQSRPQPPIRKMVAGSVNRPPVGLAYNPNGNLYESDAVSKGASIPVVGKNTPAEILAYCDKVANNGM